MLDSHVQMQLRDAMLAAYDRELRRLRREGSITEQQADMFDRANISITLPTTLKNRGQ